MRNVENAQEYCIEFTGSRCLALYESYYSDDLSGDYASVFGWFEEIYGNKLFYSDIWLKKILPANIKEKDKQFYYLQTQIIDDLFKVRSFEDWLYYHDDVIPWNEIVRLTIMIQYQMALIETKREMGIAEKALDLYRNGLLFEMYKEIGQKHHFIFNTFKYYFFENEFVMGAKIIDIAVNEVKIDVFTDYSTIGVYNISEDAYIEHQHPKLERMEAV